MYCKTKAMGVIKTGDRSEEYGYSFRWLYTFMPDLFLHTKWRKGEHMNLDTFDKRCIYPLVSASENDNTNASFSCQSCR